MYTTTLELSHQASTDLETIGAFPLERNSAIHFSIFESRFKNRFFFSVCGHKKLTNTRDPNRDPNRSSACDFLETARLFAARCVCGRCRKEKIDKLQPTIPCAKINIRPPTVSCLSSTWFCAARSVGDISALCLGSQLGHAHIRPKKIEKWIAIHFSIFFCRVWTRAQKKFGF